MGASTICFRFPCFLFLNFGFSSEFKFEISTIKLPMINALPPTNSQKYVSSFSMPNIKEKITAQTGSSAYNIAALTGESCFCNTVNNNNAKILKEYSGKKERFFLDTSKVESLLK